MNSYAYAIKMAIIIFPLLAVIITLPYMISQYRKYGSIPFLRTVVIYSFILYLLVIYFLVILPLPPIEEVKNYTTAFTQLKPFFAVSYLVENINFKINDFNTYSNLFFNSYFYQFIYNIFITIPFGVYLRYYFKCSFKKIFCYSLFLSLFFELTQLSGLYGIYPRPYRIFDVDDLITNILGGILGYIITPVLLFFFPKREKIDEKAYLKGKEISVLRRGLAFLTDFIVINILLFITYILTKNISLLNNSYVQISILVTIYFIIVPFITKGRTLGRVLVNIRLVSKDDNNCKLHQYFVREYTFLLTFIISIPILSLIYKETSNEILKMIAIISTLIFMILILIFILEAIIEKEKRYFYEKISRTKYISTVGGINEESDNWIRKQSKKRRIY